MKTQKRPSPWPPRNPIMQLSIIPQVLPFGIGALEGDSLAAAPGGGKYRPFTDTMRQMFYLLSLGRWVAKVVAPIFLRTQLAVWAPFPP